MLGPSVLPLLTGLWLGGSVFWHRGDPPPTLVVEATLAKGLETPLLRFDALAARRTGASWRWQERFLASTDLGARVEVVLVEDDQWPSWARQRLQRTDPRFLKQSFFIEEMRSEACLRVTASGVEGLAFGLSHLLESYLDVRFLMPTEEGTLVPTSGAIEWQQRRFADQPAFFLRHLTGLPSQAVRDWVASLRGTTGVALGHQMAALLPPESYRAHWWLFPEVGGKRQIPVSSKVTNWQPCWTAPDLTDAVMPQLLTAVQKARSKEQDALGPWVSLGINDSWRFCNCLSCGALARETGSHSEAYFRWCVEALNALGATREGVHFSTLAYFHVAKAPSFPLPEALFVFLTEDRHTWQVGSERRKGKRHQKDWQKVCPHLGLYTYWQGTPYLVPRMDDSGMQRHLRWGLRHGLEAIHAEAFPNFGEGPKWYLAMKLLWDPGLDRDEVLDQWAEGMVGPQRASALLSYFSWWEHWWRRLLRETSWRQTRNPWLPFWEPSYLLFLTEADWRALEHLLAQVTAPGLDPAQRARMAPILSGFRFYRESYRTFVRYQNAGTQKERQGLIQGYLAAVADVVHHPQLGHRLPPDHPVFGPVAFFDLSGAPPNLSP